MLADLIGFCARCGPVPFNVVVIALSAAIGCLVAGMFAVRAYLEAKQKALAAGRSSS